jgi:D-sedoheptulose 7-phosphate isomerase
VTNPPPRSASPDLASSFREARIALDALLADARTLERINACATSLAGTLQRGDKILLCGNGGSCCDAAHFAEELTGRFRKDRRPLAAIACNDAGHLTCTANDYGFAEVFSRWVQALGRSGDALIVLSTSGASENIVRALKSAKELGVRTIGLLGKDGGACKALCDEAIIVPGNASDRIQELHMLILHAWVEGIERALGLA